MSTLLDDITGAITGLGTHLSSQIDNSVNSTLTHWLNVIFVNHHNVIQDIVEAVIGYTIGYELFGAAGSATSSSGTTTAAASGGGGLLGSIFGKSSSEIAALAADIAKFIQPIEGFVNDTTKLINQFNDTVVTPVTNLVNAVHDDTHAIVTSFHDALKGGLKGLVALPGQLASEFDNLNSVMFRSMQEMQANNTDLVTHNLVPGLTDGIGTPLVGLHATFSEPVFTEDSGAVFEQVVSLDNTADVDTAKTYLQSFEQNVLGLGGFFGPLIKAFWGMLKMVDFAIAEIETVVRQVSQTARATNPVELLGVGETIEAYRRGILSETDKTAELLKHGVDPPRQQVLYDLAQFLFAPSDAVRLQARGIIDQRQFAAIMDQNNLDAGQSAALVQLLEHILGPGDLAAAYARGYITTDLLNTLRDAAQVPGELMDIIQQLELDLVDPKLMTALAGRVAAQANNFMGGLLTSPTPDPITKQFDRAQAENGTADLAWLQHWKVPGAEWFVQAYFRKQITLTELQEAFALNNIPEGLWDAVLEVEKELPPVWLIPDVIASGVWGESEAIPYLEMLGFDPAIAKVLYDYGYSKSKASKATTAATLQKLSLSNAAALYDDGIIDEATYEQILLDHGYSQEAATLEVELTAFKQQLANRKSEAQGVIDAANLGQIDETTVQSQLFAMGMTQTEVDKWLLKLHKTKLAKAKLPTIAELTKMAKNSLIDQSTWVATVEAIGYSSTWANLLYQIQGI